MSRRLIRAIRAYLGDIATAVGCWGFILFVVGLPLSYLATHLFSIPPPNPDDSGKEFREIVWFRLVPLLLSSMMLLTYGFYESVRFAREHSSESQRDCWRCWTANTWTKGK